jgi:hypothetical protein
VPKSRLSSKKLSTLSSLQSTKPIESDVDAQGNAILFVVVLLNRCGALLGANVKLSAQMHLSGALVGQKDDQRSD